MAKQIVARQQGDNYQARWFWLQACALLDDFSKIERVVYEDSKLKSFDDVAVYYRSGYTDEKGMPLDADFYQVKFHVTSAGALTAENLCDPSSIGAKTCSLLQRIKNAYDHCRASRINHRLILYTPWSIHPDDLLAEVHSLSDGSIRWDTLATGGERSKLGKLRKRWREHLGLHCDDELRQVLANVRIEKGPTLDGLARSLNWRLEAKGLKPVEENSLIHPYDELTKKMLGANMNELTAKSLLEICDREGLLVRTPTRPANVTSLGIRSFLRWAEDLQNQTQFMICLSHHYAGRGIKNRDDWNTEIPNSLATFMRRHIVRGGSYRLHLDTHSSVAFLAGHLLPEKMGINVEVVQHSGRGTSFWSFANGQETISGSWEFVQETCHHGAAESALAIGLTHNIRDDVVRYIWESLPSVGRVVLALPAGGPSSSAVRDGAHAEELANQLTQYLRFKGIGLSAENRVHIFSAAPNGFVFCLGRKMQSFPHWTLYEYDFGSGIVGAYSPSITNHGRR
jgi:hypothetical protein